MWWCPQGTVSVPDGAAVPCSLGKWPESWQVPVWASLIEPFVQVLRCPAGSLGHPPSTASSEGQKTTGV